MTWACKTEAAALSYLAKNFEDEYIERGLHCHNEIQITPSEHDELCVGHEAQEKKIPCSLPLWRGVESREGTRGK